MVVFDANVLIGAMRADIAHHALCHKSVIDAFESGEPIGWHPGLGSAVLRITTNPNLFEEPSTPSSCASFLDMVRVDPDSVDLHEGRGFWELFLDCLEQSGVRGPRVSDCYWAALCIYHDATLVTIDNGFAAYPGLKWKNLLN